MSGGMRGAGVWRREAPVERVAVAMERWTPPAGRGGPFEIEVRTGKPLDVLAFKGTDLGEVRDYAAFLKRSAQALYGEEAELETLASCPACDAAQPVLEEAFRVFGVAYHQCPACGHGFVGRRPSAAAFARHFAASDDHAAIYTDSEAAERRIARIVAPKLDWVLDLFRRHLGRAPATALDIGAGGGHFVAAARRAGIGCDGFELAEGSRRFARETFGIALDNADFRAAPAQPVDLVTFWGLLEYIPAPRQFLRAARARLQPGRGMLVVEVPRFEAAGTLAQIAHPEGVARHMDPSSHINCFSDSGLFSALVDTGFRPVAAWYFGMDAYELLVQCALVAGEDALVARLAHAIPLLQAGFDHGRLCDDIIVAAVPVE
ncbi:MAG: class I SAM-dependent methyltransferase [Hyphomicrobiales bacterium]|nr:class I SAM-dependent methyltransferase [Hyphomicrobiales bacterium]MCA1999319.1 class I SAM-dependent methyltransferase [Hyphomicrobiales bacterium]